MKSYHREVKRIAGRYGMSVLIAHGGHLHIVNAEGRRVTTASNSPRIADNSLSRLDRQLRAAAQNPSWVPR